jgi:hypothetical protein
MKEQKKIRPIRFFCKECGDEMFDLIDLDDRKDETLGYFLERCKCMHYMLKEIRKNKLGERND